MDTKTNGWPGGWFFEDFKEVTLPQGADEALRKAVGVGTDYKPVLYLGHRITNGINHLILAEQTSVTLHPTEKTLVIIHLYIPAGGVAGDVSATITKIESEHIRV